MFMIAAPGSRPPSTPASSVNVSSPRWSIANSTGGMPPDTQRIAHARCTKPSPGCIAPK